MKQLEMKHFQNFDIYCYIRYQIWCNLTFTIHYAKVDQQFSVKLESLFFFCHFTHFSAKYNIQCVHWGCSQGIVCYKIYVKIKHVFTTLKVYTTQTYQTLFLICIGVSYTNVQSSIDLNVQLHARDSVYVDLVHATVQMNHGSDFQAQQSVYARPLGSRGVLLLADHEHTGPKPNHIFPWLEYSNPYRGE